MHHTDIFNKYLELFESTFDGIYELDQHYKGIQIIGLAGTDPDHIAHRVGLHLMRLRVWSDGDLTKEEGRRSPEDYNCIAHRILRWQDRPIWDAFETCKECGRSHPDGINPFTKDPVDHPWQPEVVYTLYMRFLIDDPL